MFPGLSNFPNNNACFGLDIFFIKQHFICVNVMHDSHIFNQFCQTIFAKNKRYSRNCACLLTNMYPYLCEILLVNVRLKIKKIFGKAFVSL